MGIPSNVDAFVGESDHADTIAGMLQHCQDIYFTNFLHKVEEHKECGITEGYLQKNINNS